MYTGPVYSVHRPDNVCPWCVADGSAADKWGAGFTDFEFRDSHRDAVELPLEIYNEVYHRTLGVVGALQPVTWWIHCGEPAAFLKVEDERVLFRCCKCGKRRSYRDLD